MTRTHARTRRSTLYDILGPQIENIFAATDYQSILVVFSQYWNDGADDELHVKLIASRRSMPLWPHPCPDDMEPSDDADGEGPAIEMSPDDNEGCDWCAEHIGYANIGSTEQTRAFESYCHESANQEQSFGENFLPYAIGRRQPDGRVRFEILGVPQRPELEIEPARTNGARWLDDPRARSLYDLVCAAPTDDGPRRVLADYLLEREQPHGELIALSLADALDDEARARLGALHDDVGRGWLGPLAEIIPYEAAVFERGFLSRALVAAHEKTPASTLAHPAWGTVESIQLHPGSALALSPAMVALKQIGMIESDHERLFGAARPWAIEHLRIRIDKPAHFDQLVATRLLPQLRELVVGGKLRTRCLDARPVEKLVILDAGDYVPSPEQLRTRPVIAVAMEHERDRAGWELAFCGERVSISMVGWHPGATLGWLARRIAQLPEYFAIELAASPYFAPVEADLERLRDRPTRVVALSRADRS